MTQQKEDALIEALFSDEVIELPQNQRFRAAMRIAGYCEKYRSGELKARLRDRIIEATEQFLAENAPNAAITLVNSMETSDKGTRDRLNAAKEVLDRHKSLTKEQKFVVDSPNPIVFLPPKESIEED